jgi:hypothetical protein
MIEQLKLPFFITSIILVSLIFKKALTTFTPEDPLVELKIVDVAKQKELGTFATKVSVGMFLKSMPVFDIIRNNFTADLILWFEYDPSKIMQETISQFSFDNGDIIKKSQPDIKINAEGKLLVKFDVRVSFKSNMSYQRFPLDDHRISLVLSNNFATPAELYFVLETTDFRYEPSLFIADWTIKDTSTDAGYLELNIDSTQTIANPKARFTINLSKKGFKDAFVIFLPLYLATFVAIFSFLIGLLNVQTRSIIAASAIPALLGYRFVLQNLMPIIAYFTTTDYIYMLLLLTAFFIFAFQNLLIKKTEQLLGKTNVDTDEQKAASRLFLENISNIVFFFIVIFLISCTTYILFFI